MDINYLTYFRQLAETENYTRAAQLLNITQPSLSYAIRKLEQELGFPLFIHQGRNIHLSEEGKAYYPYVCNALKQLASGQEAAGNASGQKLSLLGITKTMVYERFPQTLISEFENSWPQEAGRIKTTLFLSSTEIHEALLDGSLMAGICLCSEDPRLLQFRIWPRWLYALCSDTHPLAARDSISSRELLSYVLAFYQIASKRTFHYFSSLAEEFQIPFQYRLYSDSIDIAYIAGYEEFVAVTPLDTRMDRYPCHSCKITDYPYDLTLYLTIRKDDGRDSRAGRFWQCCRNFMKQHPAL